MMQEKELIAKLKEMRTIEPNKDWVSFNKKELFKDEKQGFFFPAFKPAFAGVFIFFLMMAGLGYGMVKNSVPGDMLYSVKKAFHSGEAFFVSEQNKTAFQLSLANDRLEDLVKSSTRNLGPTLNEFEANISEAVKSLDSMKVSTSSSESIQKIAIETKKLDQNIERAESLGIILQEDKVSKLNEVYLRMAEICISDLEEVGEEFLNEEKAEALVLMKELFEEGKYMEVVESCLISER